VAEGNDADGDGMPNGWEAEKGFDFHDPNDAAADEDRDGLGNAEEYQRNTDPSVADTDGDGLGDGAEISADTNPVQPDTDSDGMPDGWEVQHGLNPNDGNDAAADPDSDARDNLTEYTDQTNPNVPDGADTDADGIPDAWEVQHGLNPNDAADAATDPDGDARSNLTEYTDQTDPNTPDGADADADGIPDAWEVQHGLNPSDATDAQTDPDGDGRSNLTEFADRSDPSAADSFSVSYTYRDDGYTVKEGFLLHVIAGHPDGFALGIAGQSGVNMPVSGEGTKDSPFVFYWTPDKSFTSMHTDSPFAGDMTYHADFTLISSGWSLPYVHTVPYTVYASAEHNAADNPADQKDFESLYKADLPVITVFETVFDPSVPVNLDFIILSPGGEFVPVKVKLPVIDPESIFIDTASDTDAGNLHYNQETDRFDIDTESPDFIAFEKGGKLRVKLISYNFGDRAVSTGITLEFAVYGGMYDGFPVRINPIRRPDGSGRDENAPLITLPMLLYPEAEEFSVLNTLSDAPRLLSLFIRETGDGAAGFVKKSMPYTVTENGLVSLKISYGASIGLIVEDRDKDGIPDDWEIRYGLNPDDPADAEADPDKDGQSNLAEFTANTDPTVNPDITEPETPDADTDEPEIPDTDTDEPETPDTDADEPETPDTDADEPETPDADADEPETPDTVSDAGGGGGCFISAAENRTTPLCAAGLLAVLAALLCACRIRSPH